MNFSQALLRLLPGENLNTVQSAALFRDLLEQRLTPEQSKTALLLLARKGEHAAELQGCLQALRRLEPPVNPRISGLLDTCGTGGDGSHSINISTIAALVIAGAGGKVAKHGNKGLSSRCGSSDLMQTFGVKLDAPSAQIICSIKKNGIGYLHAPAHHPVFSRIQPLRQKIKTRTIFNLLGPLANPLNPSRQLIGVASKRIFALYVEVLKREGRTALVCHSLDGLDEISLSSPTLAAWVEKGKVKRFTINPSRYFQKSDLKKVRGGSPAQNALTALWILTGKIQGAPRDIVLLNAGAGLWIAGLAKSLSDGIELAEYSIDSGKAFKALLGLAGTQK